MNKAPKGGMVSSVNGQWYEGGEFMPINGLYCGKKGAARAKKRDAAAAKGRFIDLGGSRLFEVFQRDSVHTHISDFVAIVQADSHGEAMRAVNRKNVWANEL